MSTLSSVYSGWEGHRASLVAATPSPTPEQLAWRPDPERRSVGELVRHVSLGRVTWFAGMGAPGIDEWTVADLAATYLHRWRGRDDAVSRQWTIWRIMAHGIHHGGQFAMLVGMLGVEAFELRDLGGHIVLPELAAAEAEGESR